MVKVKSVLLLLLSLAFNIVHDLVLTNEHSHLHKARVMVVEVEDNNKNHHATVVIWGLVSATILTLFILPILYGVVYGEREE